jgi:hypothetical protein
MGSLIIAFEPPGGRPVSVATLANPHLLRLAGFLAIAAAERWAAELVGADPTMARLQAAEVERLRTALELLIPGLTERLEADEDDLEYVSAVVQ